MTSDPRAGRGRLVVISGPSGAGKTSVCHALLERLENAAWSVSITTRPPREGEQDGGAYRFVTSAQAQQMIEADELLEHAQYLGNTYGTPRKPVDEALASGTTIIVEIDVQGAAQVARRVPDSVRIFILPPTMDSLKARLAGRHTESAALQEKRLNEADGEIAFARESGIYQHFLTNDVLEETVARAAQLIENDDRAGAEPLNPTH